MVEISFEPSNENWRDIMQTYRATGDLSSIPDLPESVFYATRDLLESNGGLVSCIGRIRGEGCSENGATAILQHVLQRTLRFRKLFEHIRVREIVNGMPELSVAPSHLCDRQVRRVVDTLVRLGYLVEFSGDGGKAQYLGLNLPFIVERLRQCWEGVQFRTEAGRMVPERLRIAAEAFGSRMRRFYAFIHQRTVENWYTFLEEARAAFGGVMTSLRQAVDGASARVREAFKAKEQRTAAGSLEGKDTALLYWKALMGEAGHPAVLAITGKTRGMMKNYLKELRANDLDDFAIRAKFKEIVDGWSRIKGMKFETSNQKRGTVPGIPDFEYFYTHRRALTDLLHGREQQMASVMCDIVID